MELLITSISIYIIGFSLSFIMQRTEMAAAKEDYTKGDRILIFVFSLLSFVWVLIMLVTSWIRMIGITGYWNRPVKKVVEELKIKDAKSVAN